MFDDHLHGFEKDKVPGSGVDRIPKQLVIRS
jgi:hypothetical protein